MDTKKLRQKILDLAIRGKLVPQDPSDEPASLLLERIRAEKERLIKEGKIKRSKKAATDEEIEAPFEIPESWEWCNITEITSKITDGTHNSPPNGPNGAYKYVTAKNIKPSGIVLDNISYVDETIHNEIYARCNPEYGDILYIKDGATTGVVTINNLNEPFSLLSSVALIKPYSRISNKYLLYYLQSDICLNSVRRSMKGVGITRITLKQIEQWNIPLPPYSEQQRIANEVERWFALIDELESNEGDLLKAIDQAKSKILDLAIHGKLVPQDPNDEPAIDLLKRINPKFEACENEDSPFDIPESWEWTTGVDIFEPMKSTSPSGDTFKYIDIDAIDNKRNIIISAKQINTKDAPSRASRYTEKGNVLFSMVRPYLRNIAMVIEDECIASTGFFVCRERKCLTNSFCLYMMLSNYVVDGLNKYMKGDNSPSINKSQVESFHYPLPPYQEQLRIVAKIEELFGVLDGIKASLEA